LENFGDGRRKQEKGSGPLFDDLHHGRFICESVTTLIIVLLVSSLGFVCWEPLKV
jgi:hypothetical protein